MAWKHITDNTATQVDSGRVKKAIVQVNAALTGTITVYDNISSDTSNTVAIITNPTVGSKYEYNTLNIGFKVVASTNCDITAQSIPS
jgi:hypothetical protein